MVVLGVRGCNMALLTEQQINDILDITNVPIYLYDKICEWNAQQTTQQFEPDWSKAPEGTDSVILKSYWVNDGIWTFGQNVAKYERPAPVITPHPHAEMLAKYAEVAARRVDPWVEFERYNYLTGGWDRLDEHPSWRPNVIYHYFGDKK